MESESNTQFRIIKTKFPEQSSDLPEEIMEEILSRLPVKSILKFRCVSKPWRSLIGSKRFIKKHLDNLTKNLNSAHHNIILNPSRPQPGLKQCSLTSMLTDPFTNQFRSCQCHSMNIRWAWDSVCIVGCCNGIVCLLLNCKHFMLWNPSTRKTKKLPVFDRNDEDRHINNHGFGYDDLSGDYMVFVFFISFHRGRFERICKVYSLLANSWKIVEVEYVPPFYYRGKFASGKIHWGEEGYITYFDLQSEVFDVIAAPITNNGVCCRSTGVFGGRLGMLYDDRVGKLDIWVIKAYGVNASWEKVATIPHLHAKLDSGASCLSLLGRGPNGDILLTSGSSFEIFHPEGNGFRHCQVRGLDEFREAIICFESLVPYNERDV